MLKELTLAESLGGSVGEELTGRRYKVRLIEGDRLGSSAYYPASVLATDGPKVFTKGTPMFIDHQTPEEKALRPFGSVGNYVGELAEDAYYENDGLYAVIEVFEDAVAMIKARKDRIGISIRAKAIAEDQVMNGKRVPVVKQITEARSADFVMRPGAGGKIVSILESAIEEESGDNMDEKVLEAIESLKASFESRFTAIEESLKTAAPEVEESATVDYEAKALEIAEAFAGSTLSAEGRKRVLAMHKGGAGEIKDLIEAEEAYIAANTVATDDAQGIEESATETDVEESDKLVVPTLAAWGTK